MVLILILRWPLKSSLIIILRNLNFHIQRLPFFFFFCFSYHLRYISKCILCIFIHFSINFSGPLSPKSSLARVILIRSYLVIQNICIFLCIIRWFFKFQYIQTESEKFPKCIYEFETYKDLWTFESDIL